MSSQSDPAPSSSRCLLGNRHRDTSASWVPRTHTHTHESIIAGTPDVPVRTLDSSPERHSMPLVPACLAASAPYSFPTSAPLLMPFLCLACLSPLPSPSLQTLLIFGASPSPWSRLQQLPTQNNIHAPAPTVIWPFMIWLLQPHCSSLSLSLTPCSSSNRSNWSSPHYTLQTRAFLGTCCYPAY